jgi:hypothetical protein
MTDSTFFINYAQYGVFRDVRIAALECLVDVINGLQTTVKDKPLIKCPFFCNILMAFRQL